MRALSKDPLASDEAQPLVASSRYLLPPSFQADDTVYMCVYTIYIRTYVYIYIYIHMCIHIYVHIHIHIYTYIHIHMYTYVFSSYFAYFPIFTRTFPSHSVSKPVIKNMCENIHFLCHLTSLFLKIASSDVDVTQHCNKRGIDAATCLFVDQQKSVNMFVVVIGTFWVT